MLLCVHKVNVQRFRHEVYHWIGDLAIDMCPDDWVYQQLGQADPIILAKEASKRTYDVPSLPLLLLGLFLASRVATERLPEPLLVLISGVMVGFGRYAFVDLFNHEPNTHYELGNLDLASGFYALGNDSLAFAVGLVVLKMLLATVVVFAVVACGRTRLRENAVLVISMALVTGFLLHGSLQAALSFGERSSSLSASLSASAFHTGLLIALAAGFGLYRLLCRSAGGLTPA